MAHSMRFAINQCLDRINHKLFISSPLALLLRDSATYVIAKGVPGALGLLSVFVLLRLLGAEQFGLFSIQASTVVLWSTFASGWLCQGVVRYYSGKPCAFSVVRHGIGWSVVASLLAVLINLLSIGTPMHWMEIGLCLALAIVTVLQSVALSIWQASLRAQTVLYAEMVRALVTFTVSVLLAWLIRPVAGSLIIGAILGCSASLIFWRSAGTAVSNVVATAPGAGLRTLWSYGWPLSLWLAIQTAFPWLDRLMMQGSLGLAQTGFFAGLSDVVTRSFSLFLFPITLAAYPRLAGMWNRGEIVATYRLLWIALIIVTLLALPVVVSFHIFHDPLIGWLLPHSAHMADGIQQNHYLVGLLAVNGTLWQLALLAHKPLELKNQTLTMLLLMSGALGVKIVVNLVAIPRFGMTGAVYASLICGVGYCISSVVAALWASPPRSYQ